MCTKAGSSIAGSLSGNAARVVIPPADAAKAAEAMVSRYSNPGSPSATLRSTRPGHRTAPSRFTTSAPSGRPSEGPKSAMAPSRISRSPWRSTPSATMRTPVNSVSDCIAPRPPGQRVEHRHADGNPHLHLFADHTAPRIVGDGAVDLDTAVHRARMHHQSVRLRCCQLIEVEAPEAEILAFTGHRSTRHPLPLQTQHHDDIGVLQGERHVVEDFGAPQRGLRRHQGGRSNDTHPGAQGGATMDGGAGHPGRGDVAA